MWATGKKNNTNHQKNTEKERRRNVKMSLLPLPISYLHWNIEVGCLMLEETAEDSRRKSAITHFVVYTLMKKSIINFFQSFHFCYLTVSRKVCIIALNSLGTCNIMPCPVPCIITSHELGIL